MNKPVNFTMHKNTQRKRELRNFRSAAVRDMKDAINPQNVAGYCLITWSADGDVNCGWGTTKENRYPIESVPHIMKTFITNKIGECDD